MTRFQGPTQPTTGMRPILKGSTRKRSPSKSPHGSSEKKRDTAVGFAAPSSGRRVKFSPFAKPRRRTQFKRLQSDREENGVVTSGFAFSAADDREVKRAARRKRDMSILQTLYAGACKPRLSWISLVEDHLAFLKPARLKISHWLSVIKEPFLAEARRRQNRRVLRSRTRHALPVYFDYTDRQYVQSVSVPLLAPTRAVITDHAQRSAVISGAGHAMSAAHPASPFAEPILTPSHFGSLSTLLRKEGIPATEDETNEQEAVRNDLRGVTRRATGVTVIPHQELRML